MGLRSVMQYLQKREPVTLSVPLINNARANVLTDQLDDAVSEPAALAIQADQIDWRELDQAYQAHHFKCAACIAAGRGAGYGLRCGVGAALWSDYSNSAH